MSVDVNKLSADFARERWNKYLESEYFIETCSKDDNSSYTRDERNLDRFLLLSLFENPNHCCTKKIKLL
jgi:hypothetical protein